MAVETTEQNGFQYSKQKPEIFKKSKVELKNQDLGRKTQGVVTLALFRLRQFIVWEIVRRGSSSDVCVISIGEH